ncbi:unnamed protein product [Peronospora belbahrii]|uniref:Elicitin n=1 Tax=Peronospora belbahrii TaxID=622444 RepID=A0AAU9L098_9STRA|nr:unnamed protein product [Peronospora belbahrii]
MNTYFTLAATALVFFSSVNGEDCSSDAQANAHKSMIDLLTGNVLKDCATKSKYDMLLATTPPTLEQSAAMCEAKECHNLIALIHKADPPNCVLKIPTSGYRVNVKLMADNFETGCANPGTEKRDALRSSPPSQARSTSVNFLLP